MKKIIYIELAVILCLFSVLVGREILGKNHKLPEQNKIPVITEGTQELVLFEEAADDAGRDSEEVKAEETESEDTESEEIGTKEKTAEEGTTANTEADRKEILLVNKENKLPEEYSVTLKKLPDGVNRAAEEAYDSLCSMLEAGRKEGLFFEICSSYRDVKRQQELFDEDVEKLIRRGYSYLEAYEEVAKETMPPGHSEHSTGLAFDIVSLGYQMLDLGQERTAENKWLQEHCAEYGFILRYPKEKEEITHISYESWHFRYVGVEAAAYITEKGITLEEYIEGA